ncbi:MAG: hypothetical protein KIT34_14330 [Cyanobacteria bacterium TGS_CYA1]|nr:hypothetical protein [Cyanobacteria bacterium TGS_CYA1]
MLLENPSTDFITLAVLFLFLVATINVVLASIKKKLLVSWLSAIVFTGIGVYYLYLAMTCYTALELSKNAQQPSLEARFALFHGPQTLSKEQIKSIYVRQEWTSRKHGPENWYEVLIESKAGKVLSPNWSVSDKNKEELEQLTRLVEQMQSQGLPLAFTYKDKNGKLHQTKSLIERPE